MTIASAGRQDAAEHCGFVTRQYQKLEAGEVNVTSRPWSGLCNAFVVEAADLLRAT